MKIEWQGHNLVLNKNSDCVFKLLLGNLIDPAMIESLAIGKRHREDTASHRGVSAMAWVEDPYGRVLLVKQAAGKKLWTFPGGKVRQGEALKQCLRRQVKEELGVAVDVASLIDYYDRVDKRNITFLFRVILKPIRRIQISPEEIANFTFHATLPCQCTPSLSFFGSELSGPLNL